MTEERGGQRRRRGGREPARPGAPPEVHVLTDEGAAAFLGAITNPPEPNENLSALAREAGEIPGQARRAPGPARRGDKDRS